MKLYYVGHKKSEKINSYLAVSNDRKEAESLMKEIKGASCIVEVEYDAKGNVVKNYESN